MQFGTDIVSRIGQLAAISATDGGLTRLFLTSEHRTAADLLGTLAARTPSFSR